MEQTVAEVYKKIVDERDKAEADLAEAIKHAEAMAEVIMSPLYQPRKLVWDNYRAWMEGRK